jgi:hypothetical protein
MMQMGGWINIWFPFRGGVGIDEFAIAVSNCHPLLCSAGLLRVRDEDTKSTINRIASFSYAASLLQVLGCSRLRNNIESSPFVMQLSCHRRNRHLNESLLSQLVKKIKKT